MPTNLLDWVTERITSTDLDEAVAVLVLAALNSDSELRDYAETATPPRPQLVEVDEPDANGAFLKSLCVQGFRGIGPRLKLDLHPGPGLVVIAGRNGSGKSSLAEALEVALTGTTYRWREKTAQWKEVWRNKHSGDPAEITVEITEQGVGVTTLRTSWGPDDELSEFRSTVQRAGQKREDGLSGLGWSRPLEIYRPMLSYDELGGMLTGEPKLLYDALSAMLGLGQITDAIRRLTDVDKELRAPAADLTPRRRKLQTDLAAIAADERCVKASALLRKSSPDTAALRALATGQVTPDEGPLAQLRLLSAITVPNAGQVAETAGALRKAAANLDALNNSDLSSLAESTTLLKAALDFHTAHGDAPCPVCGATTLDSDWAERARSTAVEASAVVDQLAAKQTQLRTALAAASAMISPPPPAIGYQLDELDTAAASTVWAAWAEAPADDPQALADHLELYHPDLQSAVDDLVAAARSQLEAKDEQWTRYASAVAALCDDWDAWEQVRPRAENASQALKWLRDNEQTLKDETFAPIADEARAAWRELRQESNVDIGSMTFQTKGHRRWIDIQAAVDGIDTSALPVMSQGELHALALALFIPRATMPESPFRFVILDDPVQAMDPAKVDGLVRLLSRIAETQQVVVLSHDDRLSSAVRRARVHATILEVARSEDSTVLVSPSHDPATRYLDDARALVRESGLPEDTLRRTLPGLLRLAVEAAARDRFFTRRLSTGASIATIDDAWQAAHKTSGRVSLAIYDEVKNLDGWLRKSPYRHQGLGVVSSAMHDGLTGDPDNAVHHVTRMVDDVRAGAK